jgi:hypothetical protein
VIDDIFELIVTMLGLALGIVFQVHRGPDEGGGGVPADRSGGEGCRR